MKQIPPRVRRQVDKRDADENGTRRCVRCGNDWGLHRHHRRLKGQGGEDCPCNLIILCKWCHQWAHEQDRPQAEAEGLIVRTGPAPELIPVMVHGGRVPVWLTCSGEYVYEFPAVVRS
jgi:hypothetical protein